MTFNEKRDLILVAEKQIKSGKNTSTVQSEDVKKMMKKIAANAVCIGLYDFNRFIITNIADGDFSAIKLKWESIINDFNRCMKIIDNEGDDLMDILELEEIEEAARYTIFELEGEEHEG